MPVLLPLILLFGCPRAEWKDEVDRLCPQDPDACRVLFNDYNDNIYVPKNICSGTVEQEDIEYCRTACEIGVWDHCHELADLSEDPKHGVTVSEAIQLYRIACENGYVYSCYYLACLYAGPEAPLCYSRGLRESRKEISEALRSSMSQEQAMEKAFALMRDVCEKNLPDYERRTLDGRYREQTCGPRSCMALGNAHRNGWGTAVDLHLATEWFAKGCHYTAVPTEARIRNQVTAESCVLAAETLASIPFPDDELDRKVIEGCRLLLRGCLHDYKLDYCPALIEGELELCPPNVFK